MILFGVNRKYGIWMNIYTDLWGRRAMGAAQAVWLIYPLELLASTSLLLNSL